MRIHTITVYDADDKTTAALVALYADLVRDGVDANLSAITTAPDEDAA